MYISENMVIWEKDEVYLAETQNFDNTGKLIMHFSKNNFLDIEIAEYYPYVKKIFFKYREGEVLLNIEKIDLENIKIDKPVYIERIISYKVTKGFLKIVMEIILSFFKICKFNAIGCSTSEQNGYYSVLRLADYYKISIHRLSKDEILTKLGRYFDTKDINKMKVSDNIMHIINDNLKYRGIWKEYGFDWNGCCQYIRT